MWHALYQLSHSPHPCPETLSEAEFTSNGLINLKEEGSIAFRLWYGDCWLLLGRFTVKIGSKKQCGKI
jgi:hypothetical protein